MSSRPRPPRCQLPHIEDSQLRMLALNRNPHPYAPTGQYIGFARDYDGLAWLGRCALQKELSLLILELGPVWEMAGTNNILHRLMNIDALGIMAREQGINTIPATSSRDDLVRSSKVDTPSPARYTAKLFLAHLGALMYDGQESGPINRRDWTRPYSLRKIVRSLFEDKVRTEYVEHRERTMANGTGANQVATSGPSKWRGGSAAGYADRPRPSIPTGCTARGPPAIAPTTPPSSANTFARDADPDSEAQDAWSVDAMLTEGNECGQWAGPVNVDPGESRVERGQIDVLAGSTSTTLPQDVACSDSPDSSLSAGTPPNPAPRPRGKKRKAIALAQPAADAIDICDIALERWCRFRARKYTYVDYRPIGRDGAGEGFGVRVVVDGQIMGYGVAASRINAKMRACRWACVTLGVVYE